MRICPEMKMRTNLQKPPATIRRRKAPRRKTPRRRILSPATNLPKTRLPATNPPKTNLPKTLSIPTRTAYPLPLTNRAARCAISTDRIPRQPNTSAPKIRFPLKLSPPSITSSIRWYALFLLPLPINPKAVLNCIRAQKTTSQSPPPPRASRNPFRLR